MSEIQRLAPTTRLRPFAPSVPKLQLRLLGGFAVDREAAEAPVVTWRRRGARTLTKLLATHPRHALHREQIIEALRLDVAFDLALNSFGKALDAARRALEPELPKRRSSAYLRSVDSVLMLETKRVVIDADEFQHLGEAALRSSDIATCESALGLTAVNFSPKTAGRIGAPSAGGGLVELRLRLLLGMADALDDHGRHAIARSRKQGQLVVDGTRRIR